VTQSADETPDPAAQAGTQPDKIPGDAAGVPVPHVDSAPGTSEETGKYPGPGDSGHTPDLAEPES